MFLCLGVALIVDGIDGTMARRVRVAELLPRWSGDVLDLVVDFVTYVFVPAYAIAAGGLLPDLLALPAGIVIVVTGALYFADREMKTADNYFRGFPALWNVVAFYLFLLRPPPWLAAARRGAARGADLRCRSSSSIRCGSRGCARVNIAAAGAVGGAGAGRALARPRAGALGRRRRWSSSALYFVAVGTDRPDGATDLNLLI